MDNLSLISRDDVEELRKLVNIDNIRYLLKPIYQLDLGFYTLDKDYLTMLHVAACRNSLKCFEYLHIQCNIPIDIESSSSFTPFLFAV